MPSLAPIVASLVLLLLISSSLPHSFIIFCSAQTTYDFSSFRASNPEEFFDFPADFMTFTNQPDPTLTRNSNIIIKNLNVRQATVSTLKNAISLEFTNCTIGQFWQHNSTVDNSRLRLSNNKLCRYKSFPAGCGPSDRSPSRCITESWLNDSVIEIVNNIFIDVNDRSDSTMKYPTDTMHYSNIIEVIYNYSGFDNTEMIIRNNTFYDNDVTLDGDTNSEGRVEAFILFANVLSLCSDCQAEVLPVYGMKKLEISHNKLHDTILHKKFIEMRLPFIRNTRQIIIENNVAEVEFAARFSLIEMRHFQIDNSGLPGVLSSSPTLYSVSNNFMRIKHLSFDKWSKRWRVVRSDRVSDEDIGCRFLDIETYLTSSYSALKLETFIQFIDGISEFAFNNNTFVIEKNDDFNSLAEAEAVRNSGSSYSCMNGFKSISIRLNAVKTHSTYTLMNQSYFIRGLNSLTANNNNLSSAPTYQNATTGSDQALELQLALPILGFASIEVSRNFASVKGMRRQAGIDVTLLGAFDFDRILVEDNRVEAFPPETLRNVGITLSTIGDLDRLQNVSRDHKFMQGWARGKLVSMSRNTMIAQRATQSASAFRILARYVSDVEAIRVEDNHCDMNTTITKTPDRGGGFGLGSQVFGIELSFHMSNVDLLSVRSNRLITSTRATTEVIANSRSSLVQATSIGMTFSGYASGNNVAPPLPEMPANDNIRRFLIQNNTLTPQGLTSDFFGSRTNGIVMSMLLPLINTDEVLVTENKCSFSNLAFCPPNGCGFFEAHCGSNCNWNKLRVVNNQIEKSGNLATPGRVSNLDLLQFSTLPLDFGTFQDKLAFPIIIDGINLNFEINTIEVGSNSLLLSNYAASTFFNARFAHFIVADHMKIHSQVLIDHNTIQTAGSTSVSASSTSFEFAYFETVNFLVTVVFGREMRGISKMSNVSIAKNIHISSNTIDERVDVKGIIYLKPVAQQYENLQTFVVRIGSATVAPAATCTFVTASSMPSFNGLFIENTTLKGTVRNSTLFSITQVSINFGGSVCISDSNFDLVTSPSSDHQFGYVIFNTYPKTPGPSSDSGIITRSEISFPLSFGVMRSTIKLRCSSSSSSSSIIGARDCSFFESRFAIGGSTRQTLLASTKERVRSIQILDSRIEFADDIAQQPNEDDGFSSKSSIPFLLNQYRSSLASSGEILKIDNCNFASDCSSLVKLPFNTSFSATIDNSRITITKPPSSSSFDLISFDSSFTPPPPPASEDDDELFQLFTFRQLNFTWGASTSTTTDSTVEEDHLRIVSGRNPRQKQILISQSLFQSRCLFLNDYQLCETSPFFDPLNENITTSKFGLAVNLNHQMCTSTAQDFKCKVFDKTNASLPKTTPAVDKSLYEFSAQAPQQAVKSVDKTANAMNTVTSLAGDPAVAMIAGRGLALADLSGCPRYAPNGQKWTQTTLDYPQTFFPASFGLGSEESGYYRRGAILGFLVFFALAPVGGVIVGLVKHRLSTRVPGVAESSVPSKSNFVRVYVVKSLTVVLGLTILPMSEHAALLTGFVDAGADGGLIFAPLLLVFAALGFLIYALFKVVVTDEYRKQQKAIADKDERNKEKKKQPQQPSSRNHQEKPDENNDDSSIKLEYCHGKLEFITRKNIQQQKSYHRFDGKQGNSGWQVSLRTFLRGNTAKFLLLGNFCWKTVTANPAQSSIFTVLHRVQGPPPLHQQKKNSDSKKSPRDLPPPPSLRDKIRGRVAPFHLVIMCFAACLVGFLSGLAKLHPETMCPTMQSLIAVINCIVLAIDIGLFPIQINPFRAWLHVFLDFTTAIISIIIAASLHSPAAVAAVPGLVAFVSYYTFIAVVIPSILITVSLGSSIALLFLADGAVVPISSSNSPQSKKSNNGRRNNNNNNNNNNEENDDFDLMSDENIEMDEEIILHGKNYSPSSSLSKRKGHHDDDYDRRNSGREKTSSRDRDRDRNLSPRSNDSSPPARRSSGNDHHRSDRDRPSRERSNRHDDGKDRGARDHNHQRHLSTSRPDTSRGNHHHSSSYRRDDRDRDRDRRHSSSHYNNKSPTMRPTNNSNPVSPVLSSSTARDHRETNRNTTSNSNSDRHRHHHSTSKDNYSPSSLKASRSSNHPPRRSDAKKDEDRLIDNYLDLKHDKRKPSSASTSKPRRGDDHNNPDRSSKSRTGDDNKHLDHRNKPSRGKEKSPDPKYDPLL